MFKNMKEKRAKAQRRAARVRAKIRGTAERPRLSVHRSLRHMSVQVIDDVAQKTLVSVSDVHVDSEGKKPMDVAALLGAEIAKRAQGAGITQVVFDRGPYLYHGRVKALAEAAREGGLTF